MHAFNKNFIHLSLADYATLAITITPPLPALPVPKPSLIAFGVKNKVNIAFSALAAMIIFMSMATPA